MKLSQRYPLSKYLRNPKQSKLPSSGGQHLCAVPQPAAAPLAISHLCPSSDQIVCWDGCNPQLGSTCEAHPTWGAARGQCWMVFLNHVLYVTCAMCWAKHLTNLFSFSPCDIPMSFRRWVMLLLTLF